MNSQKSSLVKSQELETSKMHKAVDAKKVSFNKSGLGNSKGGFARFNAGGLAGS